LGDSSWEDFIRRVSDRNLGKGNLDLDIFGHTGLDCGSGNFGHRVPGNHKDFLELGSQQGVSSLARREIIQLG